MSSSYLRTFNQRTVRVICVNYVDNTVPKGCPQRLILIVKPFELGV